ncbi:hypothetical protein FQZ97_872820 [compost metagenome]
MSHINQQGLVTLAFQYRFIRSYIDVLDQGIARCVQLRRCRAFQVYGIEILNDKFFA